MPQSFSRFPFDIANKFKLVAVLVLCTLAGAMHAFAAGRKAERPEVAAAVASTPLTGYTLTEFNNITGAGTLVMFQGSGGVSINAAGVVTGFVRDPNNLGRGFVRATNGSITEFDAPGAGTGTTPSGQGTHPVSINTAGQIAGFYEDNIGVYHGFIRNADGTFVTPTIDVPAADEVDYHLGTALSGIDAEGDVTGFYRDTNMVTHGFMRLANGTISSFDAEAVVSLGATEPLSINSMGTVTGMYIDANDARHGFVRTSQGTIAIFDVPGSGGGAGQGTYPTSINTIGDIVGMYADVNNAAHGFKRAANGTITTFDVPGAGTVLDIHLYILEGTFPFSINDLGVIVGFYGDSANAQHCFVRATNGTINTYDVAGAGTPGMLGGTACTGINGSGEIVGLYTDTNTVFHGFVLTPTTPLAATTTSLGALPNPAALNGTTSLTAAVSSTTAGTITGDVTFSVNSATLGWVYLGAVAVSGGQATLNNVAVTAANGFASGANTVYVTYSGAPGFAASNGSVGLTVVTATATATPTFNPPAGTYTSPQNVKITDATLGATIYYTMDGTPPTTASKQYTSTAIPVSSTTLLQAIAVAPGDALSAVASAVYNFPLQGLSVSGFEAAGAGTSVMYQGTGATSINASGVVTGIYRDTNGVGHGFVRATNGVITEFNAPGAGTGAGTGTPNRQGTFPLSINAAGQIAGFYGDSNALYHGFERNADGTFAPPIDIPGADTLDEQAGTIATSIDTQGDVAGFYLDTNLVYHGFVVATGGGTAYPIDAPGADLTDPSAGTQVFGLNAAGTMITGRYAADSSLVYHGFELNFNGTFISPIDPPEAGGPGGANGLGGGTSPVSINSNGDITGGYTDASGARHGFVRPASTGTITSFDVPGAGTGNGDAQGTEPISINELGVITGMYRDSNSVFHCFVRAVNGAITTFDAPGAGSSGLLGGTLCSSLNTAGEITGIYTDTNAVFHAFVLTPPTPLAATTTTLSALPNPVALNGTTTLTATMTSTTAGTISGEVTFALASFGQGTLPLGSAPVSGGKATLNNVAVTNANGFFELTNPIIASYSGGPNFAPSSGSTGLTVSTPPPPTIITTLSPFEATAGGAGFTLTVNGTNFVSGSTVYWGSTALTTTYVSTTQLTAPVPVSLIAAAGSVAVVVATTAGISNPAMFTIVPTGGLPLVLSLSPVSAKSGSAGFALTIYGANFVSGSRVLWNGSVRATTFVSSTQLTAAISTTDIAKEATNLVTVANPAPNAATSAAQPFAVQSSVPVAKLAGATLEPVGDGSGNYLLTLTGSDFVPNSLAEWNGTAMATEYVDTWHLLAGVTAQEYGAISAAVAVTVVNPSGTSAAFTLP